MTLLARDVMQTDVLTVPPTLALAELADFLIRERISGVPVIAGGELVGHVSRSDIVRAGSLERSLAGLVADEVEATEFAPATEPPPAATFASLSPELRGRAVRDIMVTEVVTVAPDASVVEVARLLLARHLHRVVVTENRAICGVISALDLVRLIAEERVRTT